MADEIIASHMMGKAGHALEVAVGELFNYSGFEVERNRQTRVGEIDVIASSGPYTVVVECKEYNPSSTAIVIRDMISNVAKKTELLGFKNAVLVTTKPPSAELLSYAAEAGVIVRSLDDLGRIRKKWSTVPADQKVSFLAKEFNLTSDQEGAAVKRRKMFLEELVRNPSKDLVKRTGFSLAYKVRFYLLGLVIGLVIVLGTLSYLYPGFRETLFAVVIIIVAPFAWQWYKKEYLGKPERRKKRRSR